MALSGYKIREMNGQYIREARIKDELLAYRPFISAQAPDKSPYIEKIRNGVNKDIAGWLIIPGTRIDYPFVLYKDNDYYLSRDIYGNPAAAGTLFMDCRNDADFSGFNTIIYGHDMKNGSMFGDLKLFADEDFFESHPSGTILMQDNMYKLEFFAYLIACSDDSMIYDALTKKNGFFDYIRSLALNYREPETSGPLVTLSTCSYEFDGARAVLLANIKGG